MDIRIEISGDQGKGKTTTAALIKRALERAGAKVVLVDNADLAAATEALNERIDAANYLIVVYPNG